MLIGRLQIIRMTDPGKPTQLCVDKGPLPVMHWRLQFIAQGDLEPRHYLGPAWRGALGYVLQAHHQALFERLYAVDDEAGKPSPLVLSPPRLSNAAEDDGPLVDLIVCGAMVASSTLLITALAEAARGGLHGCPLHLIGVQKFHPAFGWQVMEDVSDAKTGPLPAFSLDDAPPSPTRATLHLLHPLRLKGPRGILRQQDLTAAELLARILRRHHNLLYDWSGRGILDWAQRKAACARISAIEIRLNWHDWQRYSHRQERHVPMGGLLGHLTIAGPGLAELWPYLWLGQWLHVGKGTMMGLGQYALEAHPS